MQRDFIVLRVADCRDALTPEWQQALAQITKAIEDHRLQSGKGMENAFVLDLSPGPLQKHGVGALEVYMHDIGHDPNLRGTTIQEQATSAASDHRRQAIFSTGE